MPEDQLPTEPQQSSPDHNGASLAEGGGTTTSGSFETSEGARATEETQDSRTRQVEAAKASEPATNVDGSEPAYDLDKFHEGGNLEDALLSKKSTKQEKKSTTPAVKVEEPAKPVVPPKEDESKKAFPFAAPLQPKEDLSLRPPSRDDKLKSIGVPESQWKVYKSMSNEAFNTVTAELKDYYTLKALVPKVQQEIEQVKKSGLNQTFYEHPEAYTLTPQYKQIQKELSQLDFESNHWKEQALKIRKGEQWTDFEVQNGKITPVLRDASDAAEFQVMQWMNNANQLKAQAQYKVGQVAESFKQSQQQVFQGVQKELQTHFPDYLANKDHPAWQHINSTYNYLKNNGFGDNPLSAVVSMIAARLQEVRSLYDSVIAEKQQQQSIQEDKRNAPPPSSRITSTAAAKGDNITYDINMFK